MSNLCEQYKNDPEFKETLRLIGDFWTLRIIAALENKQLRFCAIERELVDSNPVTLSNRLKRLEAKQIVAKVDEEYSLTLRGKKLVPLLEAIQTTSRNLTA